MPDLAEEDAARIDAMSRALVKKLLHNPIATIKENPGIYGVGPEDVWAGRQGLLTPLTIARCRNLFVRPFIPPKRS